MQAAPTSVPTPAALIGMTNLTTTGPPAIGVGNGGSSERRDAIPSFPECTTLDPGVHAQLIDEIAAGERPTAELSYLTLACWHGAEAIRVSRCGAFLLLLLAEPRGHIAVVGGGDRPDPAAAETLRELSVDHTITFIPHAAALRLALNEQLDLVLDRDNADYVFDPRGLATYDGPALKGKRKLANRFERNHDVEVRATTLISAEAHDLLATTFDRWTRAKSGSQDSRACEVERAGIASWPRSGDFASRCLVYALLDNDEPIGISVVEPMWAGTWMGVVFKTDPAAQGATAFLRRHVARALMHSTPPGGGSPRWNIQQDTGATGLRAAKASYCPLRLEAKYTLRARARADVGPGC